MSDLTDDDLHILLTVYRKGLVSEKNFSHSELIYYLHAGLLEDFGYGFITYGIPAEDVLKARGLIK